MDISLSICSYFYIQFFSTHLSDCIRAVQNFTTVNIILCKAANSSSIIINNVAVVVSEMGILRNNICPKNRTNIPVNLLHLLLLLTQWYPVSNSDATTLNEVWICSFWMGIKILVKLDVTKNWKKDLLSLGIHTFKNYYNFYYYN